MVPGPFAEITGGHPEANGAKWSGNRGRPFRAAREGYFEPFGSCAGVTQM